MCVISCACVYLLSYIYIHIYIYVAFMHTTASNKFETICLHPLFFSENIRLFFEAVITVAYDVGLQYSRVAMDTGG